MSYLKENNLPAIKMDELINIFRKDIYRLQNKKYNRISDCKIKRILRKD